MRDNKITEAFINGAQVIDDHGLDGETTKIDALIELADETKPLVGWSFGHLYQSLNAVYMRNDELHLSQWSVGGAIIGEQLTTQAIDDYNRSIMYKGCRIASVLFRDGSVVTVNLEELDA